MMQAEVGSDIGVAIVSLSGYAPDASAVSRAIALLQSYGCRVCNYYDADAKYLRFGGTDALRISQIYAAAENPNIQVVLALRGGYGLSRLMPSLDFSALAESGKLFVGHSDFTAFQMGLLAQAGRASFAGPMICDDFSRTDPSAFTLQHFWKCLRGPEHTIEFQAENNPELNATGVLWGGNLAMLTHLVGSAYCPRIEDGILFVEDVNEHPYRVERMLLQMFHAGLLKQKAIVLGDFSSYRLTDYDNGYCFESMLDYLRSQIHIPILTGLPFGHIRDKATLVVGSQATLVSQGTKATLTMRNYPML